MQTWIRAWLAILGLVLLASSGAWAQSKTRPPRDHGSNQDRVSIGGSVRVEAGEEVHGSVVAIGARGPGVFVGGHVLGDAVCILGDVTVASGGTVERDVVAIFGNVHLKPGSRSARSVVSILGTVDREIGAEVGRDIVSILGFPYAGTMILMLIGLFVPMVAASWGTDLLLALLLLILARDRVRQATDILRAAPDRCTLWGLAGVCGFPLVSAILFATVIGILPWLVLVALYVLASATGYAAVGTLVGESMYRRGWLGESSFFTQALLGLVLVSALLAAIQAIPLVGWLLAPLASLILRTMGVGAALTLWFRKRRKAQEGSAAVPAAE